MSGHYIHGYPPPQNPTYRENWPKNIQMHQPRPQKTISVTGIEAPANNFSNQQQGDQQPFHHQVPQHVNGVPDAPSFPPTHIRQPSYPNQPSAGTPLSNIPERAIHAQPFQPYQQAGYQQPVFNGPPPNFYYPAGNSAPGQYPPGAVIAPVYVQNQQQGGYLIPAVVSNAPQPVPSAAAPPAPGMVAHEQNGMVYYLDPTQLYPSQEGYQQQPNYTMPGMGGMMTPTPDGYYYPQAPQGPMYYPSQ
jgi:hypothetical protein